MKLLWASRTPEQREAFAAKQRLIKSSAQARAKSSSAMKLYWASIPKNERHIRNGAALKLYWASIPKDKRREMMTAAQKASVQARKGVKMKPEVVQQMRETTRRYWALIPKEERTRLTSVWQAAAVRANTGRKRNVGARQRMREAAIRRQSKQNYTRGRVCHYKGIRFRSSWEYRFAKALDALNLKWEYEPRFFKFDDFAYLPDFYCSDADCYYEVKGFLDPVSSKKIDAFRSTQKQPLIVVTGAVLKQFERSAGLSQERV